MSLWSKIMEVIARIMGAVPPNDDGYPLWLSCAEAELGVAEIPGPETNARIAQYHAETSLHASSDEVPWCSSFVNWVFKQVGVRGTGSARARSWQKWGDPLKTPRPGAVVVLSRGSNPSLGHVGFFMGYSGSNVKILGGNQMNQVSIANFPKTKVAAYRWPKED